MNKKFLSAACLLTAAVIWGVAFVAQDKAADTVEPFTLNAVRSLIAAAVLIPLSFFIRSIRGKKPLINNKADRKALIKAGVICGTMLCIAANFQQFGIALYPEEAAASGRSGFLTAMYIIFVPIIGIFIKKKPNISVIFAVVIATAGLYLLCLSGGIGKLYTGDLIVLCCAVCFSVQILCVDHFIGGVDGIMLSGAQFFVCGVLSAILMFIFETPDASTILSAWKPILFLAIASSCVAYTLQIIGQKYSTSPTVSSILMSMESVFAAIGGALIMGERLTPREMVGCAVMFSAIIIAQLPNKRKDEATAS